MTKTILRVLCCILILITAPASAGNDVAYRLGAGDSVRITVFDEPDMSGTFQVNDQGTVSLPLVGEIAVATLSLAEAKNRIEATLKDGYLHAPHVAIDILNYRPFYVLGEVRTPGSYPYVSGMTLDNALALAGGLTYRADDDDIRITRAGHTAQATDEDHAQTVILPGDVIHVTERFF